MERNIILNRIQTPDGTILTSYHRHDYVEYTDKNGLRYVVDGGTDYLRRAVHEEHPYRELSLYNDAPFEVIRQFFCRGGRGKDGTQPLKWVPLCEMSNTWLEACIIYNEDRGLDDSISSVYYRKELEYRKENNLFIKDED